MENNTIKEVTAQRDVTVFDTDAKNTEVSALTSHIRSS